MDDLAEGHHDQRQAQKRQEREQCEPGADGQHRGCNQESPRASIHHIHERGSGHHAHRQEVVGRAGHDVAGGIAVVELGRHALQMAVQGVPQVRLDPAAAAVEELAHAVARHSAQQRHAHQEGGGDLHLAERSAGPQRVDAVLQEPGAERGEEVRDDDEDEAERVGTAVRFEVGQQCPQFVHMRRWNVVAPGRGGKSHQGGMGCLERSSQRSR